MPDSSIGAMSTPWLKDMHKGYLSEKVTQAAVKGDKPDR
jgi:hypothetical protein